MALVVIEAAALFLISAILALFLGAPRMVLLFLLFLTVGGLGVWGLWSACRRTSRAEVSAILQDEAHVAQIRAALTSLF